MKKPKTKPENVPTTPLDRPYPETQEGLLDRVPEGQGTGREGVPYSAKPEGSSIDRDPGWTKAEADAHGAKVLAALKAGLKKAGVK